MSLFRFLLDTNILSNIVRDSSGVAADRVASRGIDRCCTSIICAAELRYGAARSKVPRLNERIEVVLSGIAILPFEQPADTSYGHVRAILESEGQPIGPTDLFIAAHALSLDLTLITANIREFSRVPNLRVENWLD